MELVIKINMDNAAFGDNQSEAGPEVARILRKLAETVERQGLEHPFMAFLRDSNGNRVGTAET